MPELRWILVIVGVLLVAGLWLWEARRQNQAETDVDEEPEPDAAGEETRKKRPPVAGPDTPAPEPELPSIRATRRERGNGVRNPPIVEIPDGLEPELVPPERDADFVPPKVPYRAMQDERLDEIPEDLRDLPRDEKAEAERRQPWVRTQPLDRKAMRSAEAPQGESGGEQSTPEEAAAEPPSEPASTDSAQQKIVALRLLAAKDRWPGRQVVDALQAEGLVFGKYSIFHRERDDGRSIFFVASMVEPGSFDLENLDSQKFPGISVFAVIPGPVDAPTTFDLMLASARRLATRLNGHLQDEQGSTLTAQRILNLREELVHFEHLARRVQRR